MRRPSFWQERAAALPEPVRRRYAAYFDAAERWDAVLDTGVDTWRRVKRSLAGRWRIASRVSRPIA